jgi:hypothetical protein
VAFVEGSAIRSPSFCCKSRVVRKVTARTVPGRGGTFIGPLHEGLTSSVLKKLTCDLQQKPENLRLRDDWMIDYHVIGRSEMR